MECSLRGETYQPIPATVHGDGGLEGVTTDGEGYQCYADQGTLSVQDQVKKQKAKITKDLGKLNKNKAFWASYLDGKKLKKWILVTPSVSDKAVLVHARKHAKIIRDLKATTTASSSGVSTVEAGSLGPMPASAIPVFAAT
jgi:hypothetical protein